MGWGGGSYYGHITLPGCLMAGAVESKICCEDLLSECHKE